MYIHTVCAKYIFPTTDYLRFSDENYKVYENKGSSFCVTLGFDKPAVIDTVVEVNAVNDTAFSKCICSKLLLYLRNVIDICIQ